jgi:catechol 2,3-dioxygenase-like lactoylglutathione lyase family enzyme
MKTGHIGLNVNQLDRAVDFYRDVFDLSLVARSDEPGKQYAFLSNDGKLSLTLWQQSADKFDSHLAGLHHLAFIVDTIDDVKRVESKLKTMHVDFAYEGIVPHADGAASGGIFFVDPDGIRLEIYAEQGAAGIAPHAEAPSCGFF